MVNIGLQNSFLYFTTTFLESNPVADPDDSILKIVYQRSLDSTINVRSVYGILNWVGDVGGFSGVIFMIFGYLGNWVAEDDMYNQVVKRVFKDNDRKKQEYNSSTLCCCQTRMKRLRDRGALRITK